ncbi:MAG: thiamine pyrophosphate-dependent enzyme, partial [Promethearchaeota archaeon]
EAYMNTGVQRSGSTPIGVQTTTTPEGKLVNKKNMPKILEAHGIPYVATANASYPIDLYEKFKKAKDIKGSKYIHILSPCPPGWGYEPKQTIIIGRLANETGFWPLYEVTYGKFELSKPSRRYLDSVKRKSITEYLKAQKRFKSIDPSIVIAYQNYVDNVWKEVETRIEEL